MMSDKIRVLIVDDLPETRENVRKLLQFESDISVVGQAATGDEAIEQARRQRPDIVLMDINMPGLDGITASQTITELAPATQIIIMSVQSEPDYMRRAMLAGTRYFLTKPFSGDELVSAVRQVHAKRPVAPSTPVRRAVRGTAVSAAPEPELPAGHVVAIFSPTGGSGCTTVAANLAVALAQADFRTLLLDGSLQFGDVAVMLNLKSTSSIADVVENGRLEPHLLDGIVQLHADSGLELLLAPPRPEMADVVSEAHLKALLELLRNQYDFVIVDTASVLDDRALAILDQADRIILLVQQSLPSLKNVSRFFDLAAILNYKTEKIWLVVSHVSGKRGIAVKDVADILKQPIVAAIPFDEVAANAAADQGAPLLLGPAHKQPIGQALQKLADYVLAELAPAPEPREQQKPRGSLARLFGRKG